MALLAASSARADARAHVSSATVAGEVSDVVEGVIDGAAVVAVSSVDKGKRVVTLLDKDAHARPGPAVPDDAVSFDVCGGRVVFVDGAGVRDGAGARVIDHAPLLGVPDPAALPAAGLCPSDDVVALVAKEGLVVRVGNGAPALLPLIARARSYAGHAPRTLRSERPYAQALSLYAPRLSAVDVDGDGDADLVAVHEGRLVFFRRAGASFVPTAYERDLTRLVGAGVDDDLRVRFVGGRAYVAVSRGAVPEKSRVVTIDGDASAPLARVSATQNIEGLSVLLGATRQGAVVARIDTTLVALSGVVLTGKVGVNVGVGGRDALALTASADVRAGKIDGSLPVVDVDIDHDGVVDVIDFGNAGKAVAHRGVVDRDGSIGFVDGDSVDVGRFAAAVPLPGLRGVCVVAPKGRVLVLRFE